MTTDQESLMDYFVDKMKLIGVKADRKKDYYSLFYQGKRIGHLSVAKKHLSILLDPKFRLKDTFTAFDAALRPDRSWWTIKGITTRDQVDLIAGDINTNLRMGGFELPEDVGDEEENASFTFEFEADHEGRLASNLNDIEEGLKMYISPEGKRGRQFPTDVGRIDLLALDKDADFLVIELKAGQATDKACSQLLRYIGWVKKHVARNKKVRGMIVCRNATDGLKYATSTLGNVTIREYEVHFSFHDADLGV